MNRRLSQARLAVIRRLLPERYSCGEVGARMIQEIDALTIELKLARGEMDLWYTLLVKSEVHLGRAEGNLEKYGGHLPACFTHTEYGCDCGWNDVARELPFPAVPASPVASEVER